VNARQLASYAQKYELGEIAARLLALESTIRPTIGFVGEFSAGKSMLINTLLGQKLLPAMDRPTTGTIVEIEIDAEAADVRFLRRDEAGAEPISVLEFNAIAMGNQSGTAVVVVPPRGVLKSGYRLVDTPGIESLNQAHEDLTCGFLPQLDGVVVCVDINKGGLHDSILDFMGRPEIRAIRDRFLFAVCRADQKPRAGREKVLAGVRKNVEAWLDLPGLEPPAADRVVLTSAAALLERTSDVGVGDLERAFEAVFVRNGEAMRQARLRRDLPALAEELIGLLRDLAEDYDLEDLALKNKSKAIEDELRELDTQRIASRNRVQQAGTELRQKLSGITDEFVLAFGRTTSEDVQQVSHDYGEALTQAVTAVASRYTAAAQLPTFKYATVRVTDRINAILSGREVAVNLVTTALLAAATGGAGAASGGGSHQRSRAHPRPARRPRREAPRVRRAPRSRKAGALLHGYRLLPLRG
jgi:GTPase SAR1 family protein